MGKTRIEPKFFAPLPPQYTIHVINLQRLIYIIKHLAKKFFLKKLGLDWSGTCHTGTSPGPSMYLPEFATLIGKI
jgi:hypothetical protein